MRNWRAALFAFLSISFFLRISSGANFNWLSAYGTSIDNTTGDGWVSHVH